MILSNVASGIVVFGHKLRFTGGAELFDALEEMNERFNIDVFLGGHLTTTPATGRCVATRR